MPTPDTQVPAEPTQPGVANATPGAGSSVAPAATPAAPAVDADALKKLTEQNAALQRDLNRMKSSFQSRESQLQAESRKREREFQEELRRKSMQGMDDETRKTYEYELAQEELANLRQEMEELRQQNATSAAKQQAWQYFKSAGVPDDKLVFDGSLEELTMSGYEYLRAAAAELQQLKSQPAQPVPPAAPAAPAAPAPLPAAPAVDLGGGATPTGGPTWADIDKEYENKGGREQFYREVEQQQIPASRVPHAPVE